jgi:hypothetical protein
LGGTFGTWQGDEKYIQSYFVGGGGVDGMASLETIGNRGKIILKWILNKQDGRAWTGFVRLKVGVRTVLQRNYRIDRSGFIARREFLD